MRKVGGIHADLLFYNLCKIYTELHDFLKSNKYLYKILKNYKKNITLRRGEQHIIEPNSNKYAKVTHIKDRQILFLLNYSFIFEIII